MDVQRTPALNFSEKDADSLFNKLFTFSTHPQWSVPSSAYICNERIWKLESLQEFKNNLNAVKSLLNDKDERWHKHTEEINKAGLILSCVKKIVKPELPTQAWCKFYEIVTRFPVIPQNIELFRSFHLCEAPGAFISALNYYLCANHDEMEWEWYANTLNPYYEGRSIKEAIVDDRLLFNTIGNWHFGTDNTGDIMRPKYLSDIKEFLDAKGPVHLVTADGSICCMSNPGEQELTVAKLQFTEILIALQVLANGGSLVIKKFTFFECNSVCEMYLLNYFFNKVHVFKPVTSKSGNSEVYVICIGYKGLEFTETLIPTMQQYLSFEDMALFSQGSIPESFMEELHHCCRYFMDFQVSSIRENILWYSDMTRDITMHVSEIKEVIANLYISTYSLRFLEPEQYWRLYTTKKRRVLTAFGKSPVDLKELYFKVVGATYDRMQVISSMTWQEQLLDCEDRLNSCYPVIKKRKLTNVSWLPVWKEISQNMKSLNSEKWLTTGGNFDLVKNSKFCNPLLLQLWNDLIKNSQKEVLPENHQGKQKYFWEWDDLADSLVQSTCPLLCEVIINIELSEKTDDCIAQQFKDMLKSDANVQNTRLKNTSELEYCNLCKLVVLDVTVWCQGSFGPEILIRREVIGTILNVIKVFKSNDSLSLCIPFPMTRLLVGVLYMTLSFFSHVVTILPSTTAPALMGQIWIFTNFQEKAWRSDFVKYMELIMNLKMEEDMQILEVIPITTLCGGSFYEYLLDINQQNMLQRLRSLISTEKNLLLNGE